MINTIFYFPNKDEITFKDYQTRSNKDYSGDDKINGRTIVFDPTQGEIWKNGQKYSYGKTTIEEWVNGWIQSYLEQAGITAIDLSQYAKTTWVNEQNFVKRSQIGDVFTDATYADGKLKFTRFGGTYSQVEIGRGDVTLKQPLSGINSANLGTPSNGQGLVYDNGSWQYRSYGSGGATYSSGIGIDINNNEISLKPASSNEIGGIKISSIEDISKPNRSYEVKTTFDGKAYVYVDWESTVYNGEYMINVNPSYIPVQVDSAGVGNLGEVVCAVDVRYNNTSVVGTLADPVIIRNGEEISSNTALQSGISASISGSNIKIKLTNVANFESNSLVIKSTVSYGGSNVGVAVVTLVGTVKAPASGADAVLLQTSADIVNIDWQHTVASPSAISAKLQIGTNVYTTGSSIAAQGYRIFYKYRNDSQWTLLNGDITINPQKYAESLLIELRKGVSDEYANTQLFAAKEIPFIVDPAPAVGPTQYKINVLSTTIKHKNGTNYFGGTLSFQVTQDDAPIQVPSDITLQVLVGGYNADAAVSYNTSTSTYSTSVTENSLTYVADYPYTLITLKSGQNYVLDSVIIPFIMEGADGSSSQQVQSIQGTVMRVLSYNSAESVCERTPWYTGDTPDTTHNVRFMDILHYTLNNKDYGYFVKKGTSGSVSHAPVEIIDGVEKINYSVNYQDISGETYISGGSEWEQFQPMSEAVFNALLAKSAYIQNLTVAKDLVITDGERNPTAGMTGTSSTINTANGGTVTTGQGDIRIWAGYPTDNNLYNCPFYVTNEGILHAKQAIIEHGTLVEKVTFERRDAYKIENNQYKPLQLARRLYEVTRGNILTSNNDGGSAYDVKSLKLTTNHLIILSRGAYKSDPLLIQYSGDSHQELHLLLPPPHHVIGQSITITNESAGLQKTNDNDPTQIVLRQENIKYIEDGQLETKYPKKSRDDASCILLTGAESGNPTQGQVTQEGTVLITTDGTNTEMLSGIWILQTINSANGTYKQGTVVDEIVLDKYAWITVTAAEGYQKEDYSNMSDNIKKLNAMWVVTGYAYKTVTSEQIQDGTIQRVDLSQDLQQEI